MEKIRIVLIFSFSCVFVADAKRGNPAVCNPISSAKLKQLCRNEIMEANASINSLNAQKMTLQGQLSSLNSQKGSLLAEIAQFKSQLSSCSAGPYKSDIEKVISSLFYSEDANINFSISLETLSGYIKHPDQYLRYASFPTYKSGITHSGFSGMLKAPTGPSNTINRMFVSGSYQFVLNDEFNQSADYTLNLYRGSTLVKKFYRDAIAMNSNYQNASELGLSVDLTGSQDQSYRDKKTVKVNFNWIILKDASGSNATIPRGSYRLELENQQGQVLNIKTFTVQ